MRYTLLVCSLLSFLTGYTQVSTKSVNTFNRFIEDGIALWNPPAMAVAVVKDGKPIYLKAFGVGNYVKQNKVDENTLFLCASTTKAFTAAALALLVDDGKVNWDDKVIDHLPNFRLKDPYMTRELTVRDLLTHRSGLGNTDYLWTSMDIPGDSAITRLVDSDFVYSPRASFIYQNLMYATAGAVVEAASEMSWDEFLKQRIYAPLGMSNTYAYLKDVENISNKASGHYLIEDKIVPITQLSADEIGPAGSMWSDITDMAKWMSFLTNNGISNGDTVISSESFTELFAPQQIIPPSQFYPSQELTQPNWRTYGLGWFQHDYQGKKVDFHTGSLPGMVAIAGLIHQDKLGVYVFSNLDHVELRHAVMYAAFDIFGSGKLSRNWSSELKELYDKTTENEVSPEQREDAPAILTVDSLIGNYFNAERGGVTISRSTEGMKFSLNGTVSGTMKHYHFDTYEVDFERVYYGEGLVNFHMNTEGEVAYLEMWGIRFDKKSK